MINELFVDRCPFLIRIFFCGLSNWFRFIRVNDSAADFIMAMIMVLFMNKRKRRKNSFRVVGGANFKEQ